MAHCHTHTKKKKKPLNLGGTPHLNNSKMDKYPGKAFQIHTHEYVRFPSISLGWKWRQKILGLTGTQDCPIIYLLGLFGGGEGLFCSFLFLGGSNQVPKGFRIAPHFYPICFVQSWTFMFINCKWGPKGFYLGEWGRPPNVCGLAISIGQKWWQTNVRIETLLNNQWGDVACTQEAQEISFFWGG
jgi:hypothetical protein